MRTKEELLKEVKNLNWFTGEWESKAWQMSIEGLVDYTKKKIIYGWLDGHIHLDRCFTYDEKFLPVGINLQEIADLPLQVKQDLVGFLHDGLAYTEESLIERMVRQIKRAIKVGTRVIWAVIDTTPDIGLRAFNIAQELRENFKNQIEMKIGCYPVFGLKNPLENRDRLDILEQAAKKADFIVGLPEKDEEEDRIGFKGHVSTLLEIAYKEKKEVHFHVDQANSAFQEDSFRVIECLESLLPEKLNWFKSATDRPKIWLVHVISPSCYNPEKFSRLVELLINYNIGVIICPTAAISMCELRSEKAPIHNSIARVIEMLKAGVRVAFGTDNVNDIFVPSSSGLILREVSEISNYIRNYTLHILVKVAMGIPLNKGDRAILGKALYEKGKACKRHSELLAKNTQKEKNIKFDF